MIANGFPAPQPTPRAVAALLSLRRGPRAVDEVMRAIGDITITETMLLLDQMQRARLATQLHSQRADQRWYIAELGAEYLNAHRIGFSPEAHCEVAQSTIGAA